MLLAITALLFTSRELQVMQKIRSHLVTHCTVLGRSFPSARPPAIPVSLALYRPPVTPEQSSSLNIWAIQHQPRCLKPQEPPPAFPCSSQVAFHLAWVESALFAKLPALYRTALRFCLTRSSSGSLITTDRLITVSITSLKQCQ